MRTWTLDEDARLRDMLRHAVDHQTIARALGHTTVAVRARIATLRDRRDRARQHGEHRT